MKRRNVLTAIALACGAAGLVAVASGLWIPVKAALARGLIAEAWDRATAGQPMPKPWPWADTWPVARLIAPTFGINQIVLSGAAGRSLAFGPGHLDGTPLPGEAGMSLVAGHRDTSFGFIGELPDGAPLIVETPAGARIEYRVTGRAVVDSRAAWQLPDAATSALALMTCFPLEGVVPGGPLRLIVFAEMSATRESPRWMAKRRPSRHIPSHDGHDIAPAHRL